MAKLTKQEIKAHAQAMALIQSDRKLDFEEVVSVIDDFHEGATHSNAAASAFFTPYELAMHMALEVPNGRILDLCSGIGTLSVAIQTHHVRNGGTDLTLVDANPDYCAVARRLLPDARVICGSVFDEAVLKEIGGGYDCVVSNPPFGKTVKIDRTTGRYAGAEAEYAIVDIASDLAPMGVFILPQQSVPFRQSCDWSVIDSPHNRTAKYERFVKDTGIELGPNLGIDCRFATSLWRGTKIVTEISVCDFETLQAQRISDQSAAAATIPEAMDLFSLAA
jgi:predicted RNA methylase